MRILASNPDTLGDLILRQPLYAALRAAGHELMLLVRRGASEAGPYAAPGAAVVELPYEPYAHDVEARWAAFEPAVRAALDFQPDLLLVAPYQWTLFEDRLGGLMPAAVRKAGMSGHLFAGDPRAGAAPVSTLRFDVVADVEAHETEVQKNAKLAAALGAPVTSADPRIAPIASALKAGRNSAARLGLQSTEFWIVCVTGTAHVSLKTWQAAKWAEFLMTWGARHVERKFLFTGLASERADVEAVIARLPSDVASRCAIWAAEGGTLDELVALTSLAAGYVGHDTGPMHIAAALGKPVIGVFGGGTWPRFVPAVTPSVAVMVHVPCVGCGWSCSFETSHCIKEAPVEAVLQAAADLDAGRVTGRERRELEPARELLAQMTREAAGIVQREVRVAAQAGMDLAATHRDLAAAHQDLASAHQARQAEADEAARARDEARQAREGRDAFELAARRLTAEVEGLRADGERLAAGHAVQAAEAEALSARLVSVSEAIGRIGTEVSRFLEAAPPIADDAAPPAAGDGEPNELCGLRESVDRLKARVRELTPAPKPAPPPPPAPRLPRRPLGQVLADWIVGQRKYNAPPPRPLPRVTIVTPSLNDASRLRRTVESIDAQDYQDLEFIVVDGGSTDETKAVLDEFRPRIDRLVIEPDDGPLHAAAKGLSLAQGDVLHILFAGDVIEPGGVLRVAEFFSRHARVQAAAFDDAVETAQGWRFVPPREAIDVYALLGSDQRVRTGVCFRRDAYERLGRLKSEFKRAADWELYLRLARRWGIRQVAGQVRRIAAGERKPDERYRQHRARAYEAFQSSFGLPGRIRCKVINALRGIAPRRSGKYGFAFDGAAMPLPAIEPPHFVPGQPITPLTNRHPDRLLFTTPDTTGGDRGLSVVYYDSACGMAMTYPPMSLQKLTALYDGRSRHDARSSTPAPSGMISPFAGYTGSRLAKLLSRLPSPYWWFARPHFEDTTANELLAALAGVRSVNDSDVRVLVVGCYEGQVLDVLKSRTKWRLAGTETNERAIAIARQKGHTVWDASPMDAVSRIPMSKAFDVLFLNGITEHLQDPLLVLRRLRQLVLPGGLVVIDTPNLDSKLLKLYGPTWIHWQAPYHRTLMGRRAMKELANLADLKLISIRTATHPYSATASAQLNALGLGGIVPEGATFANEISSRGVRLTGWAKLLWDWRGKGDVMFAVMRTV